MVLDLGSLLREFLEEHHSQEIPLHRELHLVDLYLRIQQVRFGDRLTIRSNVARGALDYSLPPLILQPLIENAIVHGIAKNPGIDTIEMVADVSGGALVFEIINHAGVLSDKVQSDGSGFGLGLSNTRQRLAQMYGTDASVTISPRRPFGVVCRITIPAQKAPDFSSMEAEALAL